MSHEEKSGCQAAAKAVIGQLELPQHDGFLNHSQEKGQGLLAIPIFRSVILDIIGKRSWASIPMMIMADIQGLIPKEKRLTWLLSPPVATRSGIDLAGLQLGKRQGNMLTKNKDPQIKHGPPCLSQNRAYSQIF
ncbi:hypothetical protein ACXO3P_01335 [Lactobacillus delbrueckii subsp. bulgaricus]